MLRKIFRGVVRRQQILNLRPLGNVHEGATPDSWQAVQAVPKFVLEPSSGDWASGWVLLDSNLVRRSPDHSAHLYFDTGNGYGEHVPFAIPSSLKGAVHEVVCLPHGLVGVQWQPMLSRGNIEQANFVLHEIGFVERVYRMLRRTLPMLWKQPKRKLEMLGLTPWRVFVDLKGAYSAASKLRAFSPAPSYQEWIDRAELLTERDREAIENHIKHFAITPRFVLLVLAEEGGGNALARTQASICRQHYRNVEVHTLKEGRLDTLPVQASDTYFSIIHAGDVLHENALYWMASVIERSTDIGLAYTDEDRLDADGVRFDPKFKPDWSPELLRSTNYVGALAAIRSDIFIKALAPLPHVILGDSHALMINACSMLHADQIAHIPAVLLHRPVLPSSDGKEKIREALARTNAVESVIGILQGCYRVRYQLPQKLPMVSILIPTRDASHLIRQCVKSILSKTSYPNYEIVIVDNQSIEREALEFLSSLKVETRVRVLRYELHFNFAAINNFAAKHARGDVLCLLNNDTEVITPDWLEEMLGQLVQEKVAVVGAKLLYPDGSVQHGGDLVGVGGVGNHAHSFLGREEPGYCNRAVVAQDLSAVTAACLVTWRHLYQELGGLDEKNLPVAFNDVDYCLRTREAGYRVVWTPHAELYHHESVSRGKDLTPEKKRRARREVTYMRKRWKHVLGNDPYYNPNLSFERPDFSLSHAPMVKKPWVNGK